MSFDNKKWTTSSSDANKIGESVIKRLRIHTSINFEYPYQVRPDVNTEDEPDVLWARIESEPMLYKPDVTESSRLANISSHVNQAHLNSVNQIILNFIKKSNDDKKYRPVVIFYDGPETYSIYSNYTGDFVRKSKPIIVNLKVPYRAILYAPNSPVVVIGTESGKNGFKGFIMAKKYMRLKNDKDFIDSGEVRYFNNASRQYEYTREVTADGKVQYIDLGGTKISGSVTKDEQAYRLKIYYATDDPEPDPAKKKRYYKVVGKTDSDASATNTYETIDGMKYIKVIEENGIDMYVDDYGEIQFADLSDSERDKKIGKYDNFGRTDFTTHGFELPESSEINMFVSDD